MSGEENNRTSQKSLLHCIQSKVEGGAAATETHLVRSICMRFLCDYALKFILLFFIVARFLGGPAAESPAAGVTPVEEPTADQQT